MTLEQPRHVPASPVPDDTLVSTMTYYNTSLRLPVPIYDRLVAMQEGALKDAGLKIGIAEMLASLVAFSDTDGDAVASMVLNYRKTTISNLDPHHDQSD